MAVREEDLIDLRKTLPAVALTLLLVFAATALAAIRSFDGQGKGNKKVKVSFDVHHGFVEDFTISGAKFTIACPDGAVNYPGGEYVFEKPMKIDGGNDFGDKVVDTAGFTTTNQVKGGFPQRHSAEGWFRYSGKDMGCTIDTGRVKWEAYDLNSPPGP